MNSTRPLAKTGSDVERLLLTCADATPAGRAACEEPPARSGSCLARPSSRPRWGWRSSGQQVDLDRGVELRLAGEPGERRWGRARDARRALDAARRGCRGRRARRADAGWSRVVCRGTPRGRGGARPQRSPRRDRAGRRSCARGWRHALGVTSRRTRRGRLAARGGRCPRWCPVAPRSRRRPRGPGAARRR